MSMTALFLNTLILISFRFVDLEKASDEVPREVIRWAMRKLGVEEELALAVMSRYTGAKQLSEQFMLTITVLR